MKYVEQNGKRYVNRQGRLIEIGTIELDASPKKARRKVFKADWAKLPLSWAEALRQSKTPATYRLAHVILFEAFKRECIGGKIILSSELTGMSKNTRIRAAKELVKLGLIKLHREEGNQAYRVSPIY